MREDFTALAIKIVAAFARNNRLTDAELPVLIRTVNAALAGAGEPGPAPKAVAVVSARASIRPDAITCMTCGKKFKSMKRHLSGVHGQTPQQYREQWGLPHDYPVVAPNYAAARSALAKSIGLGMGGHKPAPAAVALKATASATKAKAGAASKPAPPTAKIGHPKPSAKGGRK